MTILEEIAAERQKRISKKQTFPTGVFLTTEFWSHVNE